MAATVEISAGDWAMLGPQASEIRRTVFIQEQQVPLEEEWDGRDAACHHFLALRGGTPLGTARLLPDGHIGRVAVVREARGLGVGAALMRAAIAEAQRLGHPYVELAAQTHALAFYENFGFIAFGEPFLDAGIPHRSMRLHFS